MVNIYYTDNSKLKKSIDSYMNIIGNRRRQAVEKLKNEDSKRNSLCAGLLAEHFVGNEDNCMLSEHGKPYCDKYKHFNLSHSGTLVAIATADSPVGCDIEQIRKSLDVSKIAKRVLTAAEQEQLQKSTDKTDFFFTRWVIKEAYTKMLGTGITTPFAGIETTFQNGIFGIAGIDCNIFVARIKDYLLCVISKDIINTCFQEVYF